MDSAIIPSIGHAIGLSYLTADPSRVGGLIETAHSILAGFDPSDDMGYALAHNKLWSVHLNDQGELKFDEDKSFGCANLRRAFNQVLINLISNAIKFTPRGGRVTVSAQCEGPKFAVAVEDTGVGIGEDDLPRLGEAFFQAGASYDRRHDGSGLGLSIVKGLVRLHGGDLDIQSRLGEGTRVTVRLPIDCEAGRPVDPIRLVTERAGELAAVANVRIKKSA